MLERTVESVGKWGSAPLFVVAVTVVVMTAIGVAEAVQWYRRQR